MITLILICHAGGSGYKLRNGQISRHKEVTGRSHEIVPGYKLWCVGMCTMDLFFITSTSASSQHSSPRQWVNYLFLLVLSCWLGSTSRPSLTPSQSALPCDSYIGNTYTPPNSHVHAQHLITPEPKVIHLRVVADDILHKASPLSAPYIITSQVVSP